MKSVSKLSLRRLFRSTAWTCGAGNFLAGCLGWPRLMIRVLSQCSCSVWLVFAVRSHCDLGVNARRMWKCLWAAMVI